MKRFNMLNAILNHYECNIIPQAVAYRKVCVCVGGGHTFSRLVGNNCIIVGKIGISSVKKFEW